MAVITRGFVYIFVILIAVYQVSSSQPVTQYVLPNYAQANGQTQPIPRPTQSTVNLPAPTKALRPKTDVAAPAPLDSHVLNNLAIALQLLIVSNIMNMPPERECGPKFERISAPKSEFASLKSYPADLRLILEQALSKPSLYSLEPKVPNPSLFSYETQGLSKPSMYSYETQGLSKPGMYSYETQGLSKPSMYSLEAHGISKPSLYSYETPLPSANFLGSSGFAEPVFGSSLGVPKPNPRTSMTLMSPYDALGTSLFSDTLSTLPSSYTKKDFQSPYASILAADGTRDLFSTADFF